MLAVACFGCRKGNPKKSDRPKVLQELARVKPAERVSRCCESLAPDRRLLMPGHQPGGWRASLAGYPASNLWRPTAPERHGPRRPALLGPLSGFSGGTALWLNGDVPAQAFHPRSPA